VKLLINTYSANEHGEGCEYAFVDLDESLSALILKRADAFDAAHKEDPALQEIHYYGSEAVFVNCLPEVLEDTANREPWQNDAFIEVNAFSEDLENVVARTECAHMVITDQDVYWTCYPKHSDWQVETRPIPFETVRVAASLARC
jgi:hypothetical protein